MRGCLVIPMVSNITDSRYNERREGNAPSHQSNGDVGALHGALLAHVNKKSDAVLSVVSPAFSGTAKR